MKFNNRPNISHTINGKTVWESRSVAVVGVVILYNKGIPYVLISKRGPGMPNYQGKWNLVAGYLDWNESGTEAVYRECWEETGFDLPKYLEEFKVEVNNLDEPWTVSTCPSNNSEQNISMRYGVIMSTESDIFPELSTEHNECIGESEEPSWMPITNLDKYEWAFNHKDVIEAYYFLNKLK